MEARVWRQWRRARAHAFERPLTSEERAALRESCPRWYSLVDSLAYAVVTPVLGICCGAALSIFVMLAMVQFHPNHDGDASLVLAMMQLGFVGGVIAYFWPLIRRLLTFLDLRAGTVTSLGYEVQEAVAVLVYYDPAYYPDADTPDPDDEWEDTAPWAYLLDLGAGRLLWVMVGCDGVERSWLPGCRVELARSRYGNVDLGLRATGEPLPPNRTVQLLPVPEGTLYQGVIIRGTAATLEADVREAIRL